MVSNLSHLNDLTYEMSICSLGAMGTEYVRDTPVPTNITIVEGSDDVIIIEKIYSKFDIGNILDIKLRHPIDDRTLRWVSFDPDNDQVILIKPRGEDSVGVN